MHEKKVQEKYVQVEYTQEKIVLHMERYTLFGWYTQLRLKLELHYLSSTV